MFQASFVTSLRCGPLDAESALHGQPLVTMPTVDSRECERQDLEEQERRYVESLSAQHLPPNLT